MDRSRNIRWAAAGLSALALLGNAVPALVADGPLPVVFTIFVSLMHMTAAVLAGIGAHQSGRLGWAWGIGSFFCGLAPLVLAFLPPASGEAAYRPASSFTEPHRYGPPTPGFQSPVSQAVAPAPPSGRLDDEGIEERLRKLRSLLALPAHLETRLRSGGDSSIEHEQLEGIDAAIASVRASLAEKNANPGAVAVDSWAVGFYGRDLTGSHTYVRRGPETWTKVVFLKHPG